MCVEGQRTISITTALDGADGDSHGQARRQAPDDKARHGAEQADDEDGLAAVAVGGAAPGHGGDALGERKGGRGEAGPGGNVVLGDAEAADHVREVRVHRGVGEGLGEAGDGWR